jgi:hypothetical protein
MFSPAPATCHAALLLAASIAKILGFTSTQSSATSPPSPLQDQGPVPVSMWVRRGVEPGSVQSFGGTLTTPLPPKTQTYVIQLTDVWECP